MSMRLSIDLQLAPAAAFDAIADDLALALHRLGLEFRAGDGGQVTESGREVGRVVRWQPPEEIEFDWLGAAWQPSQAMPIRVRFERLGDGTRVTFEIPDPGNLFGDRGEELGGWFAGEVGARLLYACAPDRLGDWLTDRRARRPSGPQSRAFYRDPLYHRPNFKAILRVLKLQPEDRLVEVGCGGGAFLSEALASGCRAAAVDYSADMVRLARELNRDSIAAGRLEIREAAADLLPFPDASFTCAVSTGVLGFLLRPLEALREIHRVLLPGGRLVLFTASKELRGTPAAPEPIASRLSFYEDEELEALARQAGFSRVQVDRPDIEPFAREVGIPEDFLELFRGRAGGQLLTAQK
jgi:SAM-dependent methyltransferase